MADLDLERIIADLRERREKIARQMEETLTTSTERAQLFEAAGRLRDRIKQLAGATPQEEDETSR